MVRRGAAWFWPDPAVSMPVVGLTNKVKRLGATCCVGSICCFGASVPDWASTNDVKGGILADTATAAIALQEASLVQSIFNCSVNQYQNLIV
jgi:hypothetical protein